jgi:predicted transcriptional regulator
MNQRSSKYNNIKYRSGCCASDLQVILLLEMSRAKAYLRPLVGAGDGGAFWRRLPS